MSVHSFFNLVFRCSGREIESAIERVESEEVSVLSIRRARTAIDRESSSVHSGIPQCRWIDGCGNLRESYIKICDDPVNPETVLSDGCGDIGIIHDECERHGIRWHIGDREGRRDILSIAGIAYRNQSSMFEHRA